jgi:transcriptional regulator with XRE-family HTH domain
MEPSFSTAIKTVRKRKGLLQKYVAWTSGIGPKRYNQIESGKTPTDSELADIAKALGTDPSTLVVTWAELLQNKPQKPNKSNRLVS